MKGLLGQLLCEMGFHAWHERKNGNGTERVCMRPGCKARLTMYREKGGEFILWNGRKIPVRSHAFIKTTRGT